MRRFLFFRLLTTNVFHSLRKVEIFVFRFPFCTRSSEMNLVRENSCCAHGKSSRRDKGYFSHFTLFSRSDAVDGKCWRGFSEFSSSPQERANGRCKQHHNRTKILTPSLDSSPFLLLSSIWAGNWMEMLWQFHMRVTRLLSRHKWNGNMQQVEWALSAMKNLEYLIETILFTFFLDS